MSAAEYSAVFHFICQGSLPADSELDTDATRFLAAATRLKDIRLREAAPKPEAGPAAAAADIAGDSPGRKKRKKNPISPTSTPTPTPPAPTPTPTPALAQSGLDDAAADAQAVKEACDLIRTWRFGHEHVGDNRLLRCPELWSAMLELKMPMTALVRNLGRMTSIGVLDAPGTVQGIVRQLTDPAAIHAARLHPISLLEAQQVYASGRGDKGSLAWTPNDAVSQALEAAFYLAFKNVEPTGLQWLLGVDVSGSMGDAHVCGMQALTSREAAAALLMALLRTEGEANVRCMAFSDGFTKLRVHAGMKLQEVKSLMAEMPFCGTDCSQPMVYALQQRIPVDVFVVMTDNETYSGAQHPTEALKSYRKEMNRPHAKLIVLAFSATEFSIADPNDPSMLDVAGMDAAVPRIIREFALGKL